MGYRFAVAVTVAVAAVLVVLCAPGIAISGGAWLAVYADKICAIDATWTALRFVFRKDK